MAKISEFFNSCYLKVNLLLEKAIKETPPCSLLLESFQGQTCEIFCAVPCRNGCPQSSGCQGSLWGAAGA